MTDRIVGGAPPLDTVIMVATPENVAFDFRLAGPFPRFIAMLVDFIILAVALVAIGMLLGVLGGIGLLLFLAFVGWWGYGGLMETFCNGQTVGKKAMGIRVVSGSGLAINAGQAILRNILRSADLFPPFFPGVLSMLVSSRFQRLGDLAAETVVVIDGGLSAPRPPRSDLNFAEIHQLIPARFRPDPSLIEALAAYVGRRKDLSMARRKELAQPLAMHFMRAWSLPARTDPDTILCAIYDRATMDRIPIKEPTRTPVQASDRSDEQWQAFLTETQR